MKRRLILTTSVLLCIGSVTGPACAGILPEGLTRDLTEKLKGTTIGLRFESLGVNALGVDLSWHLPFAGFEAFSVEAAYSTSRLLQPINAGLLPVDYGKLAIKYQIQPLPWLKPFAGLQIRAAGIGADTAQYPELARIDGGALAGGLSLGTLVKVTPAINGLLELNLNYPASFAFPYFSWAVGARYLFGAQ